jgi:hypothetical protein
MLRSSCILQRGESEFFKATSKKQENTQGGRVNQFKSGPPLRVKAGQISVAP